MTRIEQVVIFLLMLSGASSMLVAQNPNNNCSSAAILCPDEVYAVNNLEANVTFCPGCEDDFNFCFPTNNSIWFQVPTNITGGDVLIQFSNLIFESNPGQSSALQAVLLSAIIPCNASTYTVVSTCHSSETGNFSLFAPGLSASSTYYLVLDGDLSGGNTLPAEFTVDIAVSGSGFEKPSPSTSLLSPTSPICLNEAVSFHASVSDCPDVGLFTWSLNGVPIATSADTFFVSSELQQGDVVSVSCPCYLTCPVIATASSPAIDVTSFPINAGPDLSINEEEAVQLSAYTTASVYEWSPSFLLSDPFILNPIAMPLETTTFTFSAEKDGCTLYDYVTITVNTGIEIPNTFSPNGDEVNEFWIIKGIEKYPDNSMSIYNRWGQEVYQATGYSKARAWGGETKGGGKASSGVYYYVLDLRSGNEDLLKGTITLIR